jgi:hypothetical protein
MGGRRASDSSTLPEESELTSDPITATPSAPETIRATVLVAEAMPALAGGTAPTTASVAGAMTQPIARVRKKNQATSNGVSSSVCRARRVRRRGGGRLCGVALRCSWQC